MAAFDFESLISPVSADDPCGPDLDLTGDAAYMNFIAGAEGLLPSSYFGKDQSGNEGRPFDRNSINFDAQFVAAKPFLEKTRDLRLLGLLAKFCILNRDLDGFLACLRAMAELLSAHWEDVHPRAEDGDFGARLVAVESIDSPPTVVVPLQFLPLVEHNRVGWISCRGYMIAKGEVQPVEGEEAVDLATIEKALGEVALPALIDKRAQFDQLRSALRQIGDVWQERCSAGPAVSFQRLPNIVSQILALLETTITLLDPASALEAAGPDGEPVEGAVSVGRVTSLADAAGALAAVAGYFSRCEPSSPALLLVRQAHQLLGKSFLDVMRILVPEHVDKAAVNIGKDQCFALPIGSLPTAAIGWVEPSPPSIDDPLSGNASGDIPGDAPADAPADTLADVPGVVPDGRRLAAKSRIEALMLLDQVGNYFRKVEPTSPIPLLTDRARELAQGDFLSVLKAILPEGTLFTPELLKK